MSTPLALSAAEMILLYQNDFLLGEARGDKRLIFTDPETEEEKIIDGVEYGPGAGLETGKYEIDSLGDTTWLTAANTILIREHFDAPSPETPSGSTSGQWATITADDGGAAIATTGAGTVIGSAFVPALRYTLTKGEKVYEMKNQLGNVLAVVTDLKLGEDIPGSPDGYVDAYYADLVSSQDYYAFGG